MFAIIKDGVVSYQSFEVVIPQDGESILEFENIENPFFDGEKIIETPLTQDQKFFQKRNEIYQGLMEGSNDLSGYEFSDIEIGNIITARVFGGNPYAQMVLQAKATESIFRKMAGIGTPEDDEVIEKKNQVMTAVNQIRALFSLSPM